MPGPHAAPNQTGLEFYDRLVDHLLAAGIEPLVTLYHWDMPLWAYDLGGWRNRDMADHFRSYAEVVAARLGDRVSYWMTFNELCLTVNAGHRQGNFAPGERLDDRRALQVVHTMLMAHGDATRALRAAHRAPKPCRIGWAHVGPIWLPASGQSPEVAERAMFSTPRWDNYEPYNNDWIWDPVQFGSYPADGLAALARRGLLPEIAPGDMARIQAPMDFAGFNYYQHVGWVRAAANGRIETAPEEGDPVLRTSSWRLVPDGLGWACRVFWKRYRLPIMITENGTANPDWVDLDGRMRDPQRIDWTRRHLRQLRDVMAEGIPVAGYMHWSLMDNFEWASGFEPRFGLIHVDYATQKRTLKDSAHWYAETIRTHGENI
jgi:beta-glucosidase